MKSPDDEQRESPTTSLRSAREIASDHSGPKVGGPPDSTGRRGGRRGRRRGAGRHEHRKPAPARAADDDAKPASEPDDVEEVDLEVEGSTLTVRITGRSGGVGTKQAPLLMLGFWTDAREASPPDREALVVGGLLRELTDDQLLDAWGRSKPIPDPDRRPSFFPGTNEKRRGGS